VGVLTLLARQAAIAWLAVVLVRFSARSRPPPPSGAFQET
jgi:hypothetical protein